MEQRVEISTAPLAAADLIQRYGAQTCIMDGTYTVLFPHLCQAEQRIAPASQQSPQLGSLAAGVPTMKLLCCLSAQQGWHHLVVHVSHYLFYNQ
jgi:hypothetical protein